VRDRSRTALDEVLAGAGVHVFDVDHTLTRHSTGRRFAQAGIRTGAFRRRDFLSMPWFYLRYRLGSLTLADITREIRVIAGMSTRELRDVAAVAWSAFVANDLFPGAREHVARCRAAGARTVLLSTSFDLILEPLAQELGVETVIASELEFDGDRATGWIVGGPCYAEEKARRLTEYLAERDLPAAECAFYSDSFHDLPSFQMVGMPVPVNPDGVLRTAAARAGWPVVRWR
jgi:HAD superfamily hydrolase (TIGR01490 family)